MHLYLSKLNDDIQEYEHNTMTINNTLIMCFSYVGIGYICLLIW